MATGGFVRDQLRDAGLVRVGVPAMTKRKMKAEPPVAVTARHPVTDLAAVASGEVTFTPIADPAAYQIDLRPIHAAAEAAGLKATSLAIMDGMISVSCGPYVPPFTGASVAEVVAKIQAYQCKSCGTGGGHNPNCEKKP